jgi:hypothetical protein
LFLPYLSHQSKNLLRVVVLRLDKDSQPSDHARKFVGLKDAKEAAKLLSELAVGVLSELKDLPSKVVDPDWLEKVEEKDA